jgi:hypothetical protein
MVSVISENLRVFNAAQFKESLAEAANTKFYFTIGKPTPWANDAAPQQANSSVTSFNEVYSNMIGAKRIFASDVVHVTERYDWEANTVYPAYDHCTCSLQLFSGNTPFYVVTNDWNVYKCISNNSGTISTTKPTSVATAGTFQTADGYVWKYMYSIRPFERLRFTTSDYIPVKTLTNDDNTLQWDVQQSAVAGSIDAIKITSGGDGYVDANTISISISGDGNDAEAFAQINTASNTISSIVMTNPGSGYTYASVTATDTSGGANATFRAMISPPGGHGSDPLRELGGSKLLLNVRIFDDENGKLPVVNDFRQVAIIQDPLVYNSSNISTNSVMSQYTTITMTGTSAANYIQDEYVYQGASLATSTFKARVIEWNTANNILKVTNTQGTPISATLIGDTSTAGFDIASVTNPQLEPNSGRLIYIDNIIPVTRAIDQTEDFKLILKF